MLSKKKRLTKAQFDRFFVSGKRIHTPYIQLIYTSDASFHGAVVVGKKVYKRAVDRNKLRRQIYSILYRLHKTHGYTGVYICIAKPQAKGVTFAELQKSLSELVARTTQP